MVCITLKAYIRACAPTTGGISDIVTFDPSDFNFTQPSAIAGVAQSYSVIALRAAAISGYGAIGTAVITNGLGTPSIGAGGTGYTTPPTVAFTGGGGTGAAGTAVITGDAVTGITITNPGTGYTSPPTISFTGGGGTGATATVALVSRVQSITVTAGGSGYLQVPTVALTGGGGTGATATAVLTGGVVSSFTIGGSGGTGYTSPPTVVITTVGSVAATGAKMFLINFQRDEAEWTWKQSVKGCSVKYEHSFNLQLPDNSQNLTTFLAALDAASCCCGLGMIMRLNNGKIFVAGEKYVNGSSISRFTVVQDGSSGGSGKLYDDFNGGNLVLTGGYLRNLYEYSGAWADIEALM